MDSPRRAPPRLNPEHLPTDMSDEQLEPLITECPGCQTRFRASEVQLQQARGRVRCGACLTVFNGVHHLVLASGRDYADEAQAQQALDALLDELSAAPAPESSAAPAEEGEAPSAPALRSRAPGQTTIFSGFEEADAPAAADETAVAETSADDTSADEQSAAAAYRFEVLDEAPEPAPPRVEAAEAPSAGAAAKPGADGATPVTQTPPEPDTAPEPAAREPVVFGEPRVRRPLVWAGIAAGLILLAVQVLWYRFDEWAVDPQWRAVYGPICAVVGCALPEMRDSDLLKTRNLAVRSDPENPEQLLVSAVIVNEAEFAQPFPTLELRFTTVRGLLVAGRRFTPEEYLAGDGADLERIPPRTPVQIELAVDDPGPDAVNYFLGFR
ncbi:MAG: zinc-ribbon and DUF3426 domain-containing protein [Gammaproteobacteria bacterium]|nr:zinc-ribbon and DUF3426 domain-containing protein [Gammaproteobacteria bacterium]